VEKSSEGDATRMKEEMCSGGCRSSKQKKSIQRDVFRSTYGFPNFKLRRGSLLQQTASKYRKGYSKRSTEHQICEAKRV